MRIFYRRKYATGSYLNEDIGFEMDIPDDGDPIDEIETLKNLCDQAHKKLNPGLYVENTMTGNITIGSGIPTIKKDPKQEAIQSHIKTIGECRTIQNLKIFEALVRNSGSEELQTAYDNRLKELQ